MVRGNIEEYRALIARLLLTDDEFMDIAWEPVCSLSEFLERRVRPVVFLLMHCGLEDMTFRDPPLVIPPVEREILRDILLRVALTVVSSAAG
jgi:hypothetical protein